MTSYQFFFPGWTKKSITFSIDDGNITLDKKFLALTDPAGFKGTFNLTTPFNPNFTVEDYYQLYKDYEVADHCRYHAYPFSEQNKKPVKEEVFDPETADPDYIYPAGEKGLFRIRTYNWCYQADDDKFMECVLSCKNDLERIFGQGTIKDFIWPCGKQNNEAVFQRLIASGFRSIRNAFCVEDSENFDFPKDRFNWSYTVNYTDMLPVAEKYAAYPDDGNLKFFCFGVHSHDFENNNKWDVLVDFCNIYGNRAEEFYYASVGTLFDYEDAVKMVFEENNQLVNPSKVNIYLKVNGIRKVLRAGKRIDI